MPALGQRNPPSFRLRSKDDDGDGELPPLPVKLGATGVMPLRLVEDEAAPIALQAATWCRAARGWVTATPIALDRNPGDLASAAVERREAAYAKAGAIVRTACERIGVPEPEEVVLHGAPPLRGAAPSRSYPVYPPAGKGPQRVLVHAELRFREPVQGPILVGAGRYLGLGLMRPVDQG